MRYYSENNIDISLIDFYIGDSKNEATGGAAFIGNEIEIKGKPRLRIKGSCIINSPGNLRLEIIRGGQILKSFEFGNDKAFDLEFQDDSLQAYNKKSYYRLIFFAGDKIILITNPVFIEAKEG